MSKIQTHTPGPWEITGFADCQLITKDVPPAIGQPVPIGRTYGENQIANARLVAAAPDMLAELRKAESFISGFEGDELQEGIGDLLVGIRAAIAKTEG